MYVRDIFSPFPFWKDVLGSSLPGSWSLPAPTMRFPKGINSFSGYMDLAEEATTCQKAASGRALSSIGKAECVRERGDRGVVTAEQPARAPWSGLEGRGQEDLEKKQVC